MTSGSTSGATGAGFGAGDGFGAGSGVVNGAGLGVGFGSICGVSGMSILAAAGWLDETVTEETVRDETVTEDIDDEEGSCCGWLAARLKPVPGCGLRVELAVDCWRFVYPPVGLAGRGSQL